jgi:hypothetical protein
MRPHDEPKELASMFEQTVGDCSTTQRHIMQFPLTTDALTLLREQGAEDLNP